MVIQDKTLNPEIMVIQGRSFFIVSPPASRHCRNQDEIACGLPVKIK
jgi:hypothetical protein